MVAILDYIKSFSMSRFNRLLHASLDGFWQLSKLISELFNQHDVFPVQHLLAELPAASVVVADKGYISYKDEILADLDGDVRLVAKQRKNMRGNSPQDMKLIDTHRRMIETVNSQLEKMGLQRLHARTNSGIALKVLAALIALAFTNLII